MARPIRHRGKWRIRWLDEAGRRQSEVHDDFREAERRLREHQVAVDEIRRGLRTAAPPEKTFGELCDYWLAKRAVKKRSRADDESIVRRHLRPAFGALALKNIGIEQVDEFVAGRQHLQPQTIAHLLALLVRKAT